MITSLSTRGRLAAAVAALTMALGACGSDDAGDAEASPSPTSTASETSAAPASDEPFGAGCPAVVAAEGEGSAAGMADDPVGTAAATNPALSALLQAVTAANLVDTLNGTDNITVLAPANPAFEAVGPDALNALLADTPRLTAVLTHHVIPGRLGPDELAGSHTTLNNDEVAIEGSGEDFTVPGDQTLTGTPGTVLCGNLQTANATVYVIDQVLAPPA